MRNAGTSPTRSGTGTRSIVTAASPSATAGGAEALAVEVRDDLLRELLGQLSVSENLTAVAFDQGPVGRRFTFVGIDRETGTAVEGEITAAVPSDGQGVVFVGIAPEGLLAFIAGDLRTMVTGADFEAGS
jgi:hypothetical protein